MFGTIIFWTSPVKCSEEQTLIFPYGSGLQLEWIVLIFICVSRQFHNALVIGAHPDIGAAIPGIGSQQEQRGAFVLDKVYSSSVLLVY